MYNNFGIDVTKILKVAEEERMLLHHPYVGTEHLLLAILKESDEIASFFKEYKLTYNNFKRELIMVVGSAKKNNDLNLYTPMLKRVIANAIENAKENNDGKVTPKHLILSILEEGEGIAIRLLITLGIDIDDVYDALNKKSKGDNKKLEIYEVGTLLNDVVNKNEIVVGRDKEIDSIIETLLRKKKNNPILIGEAGVGKTAIIEELTRRIMASSVPEGLLNAKIVSLEMGSLVSGTKYRGEFEEKLTKIIKELEDNPSIILFIDEIHSMVSAGGAEGAITAGDIFKPALARGKIKCIGATTTYEYNKFFSNDKALMRRFELINISEPTLCETKDILLKIKGEYETHHHVKISNNMLDKIIDYTDRFIKNKKNPDKSIDFLDSVCAKVKTHNTNNLEKRLLYKRLDNLKNMKNTSIKNNDYDKALSIYNEEVKINKKIKNLNTKNIDNVKESDIISVLENKTNMIFTLDKLNFLDSIEEDINNELYNSSTYVSLIINAIKDNLVNRVGFLKIYLEGGVGLGKSTIVKKIASYFPKVNFIRIDLKEFTQKTDINKLIGTNKGYIGYDDDHLLSSLKNNNFSIILFDNYECAHEIIKDFIKEILKEGYITDNKGEKIYFNNSFIFITNDIYNNQIGFTHQLEKEYNELNDLTNLSIHFNNLTKEELIKYLQTKNILDIDKIINESNYEKDNYKNIDKLIKREHLISN